MGIDSATSPNHSMVHNVVSYLYSYFKSSIWVKWLWNRIIDFKNESTTNTVHNKSKESRMRSRGRKFMFAVEPFCQVNYNTLEYDKISSKNFSIYQKLNILGLII